MRKTVLGLLIAVWVPVAVLAQTADEHKGQGYVYFAPGVATFDGQSGGMLHIGAGGEGLVYKGLGVGAEAGYRTEEQLAGFGKGTFSTFPITFCHATRSRRPSRL